MLGNLDTHLSGDINIPGNIYWLCCCCDVDLGIEDLAEIVNLDGFSSMLRTGSHTENSVTRH